MKKIIATSLMIFSIMSSCTENGDIYDPKKHKKSEFSAEKTIGLIVGTAIVAVAVSEASAGDADAFAEGFANSSQTDTDHDWDYQPGNNTWVCRGVQTGQYADLDNCDYDVKDDDRWPS